MCGKNKTTLEGKKYGKKSGKLGDRKVTREKERLERKGRFGRGGKKEVI